METLRVPQEPLRQQEYLGTLKTVRDDYLHEGLRPLFVGGVLAKTVNLGVISRMAFDHAARTVRIPIDTASYTARRGDGTFDDFDVIVNHPNQGHIQQVMEETRHCLDAQGFRRHFVSTEPVRYAHWKPRHKRLQMVSGIDVDEEGGTHFTFGDLSSPPVPPATLEPWDYILEENDQEVLRLPSFNPAFLGMRYVMRLPINGFGGLRGKDAVRKSDPETGTVTTKLHTMMKMRAKALATGMEQGFAYDPQAWIEFIKMLQHPKYQDRLTHLKGDLLRFWWHDLGNLATALVHGQGIFEQAAKLGNKFGG